MSRSLYVTVRLTEAEANVLYDAAGESFLAADDAPRSHKRNQLTRARNELHRAISEVDNRAASSTVIGPTRTGKRAEQDFTHRASKHARDVHPADYPTWFAQTMIRAHVLGMKSWEMAEFETRTDRNARNAIGVADSLIDMAMISVLVGRGSRDTIARAGKVFADQIGQSARQGTGARIMTRRRSLENVVARALMEGYSETAEQYRFQLLTARLALDALVNAGALARSRVTIAHRYPVTEWVGGPRRLRIVK